MDGGPQMAPLALLWTSLPYRIWQRMVSHRIMITPLDNVLYWAYIFIAICWPQECLTGSKMFLLSDLEVSTLDVLEVVVVVFSKRLNQYVLSISNLPPATLGSLYVEASNLADRANRCDKQTRLSILCSLQYQILSFSTIKRRKCKSSGYKVCIAAIALKAVQAHKADTGTMRSCCEKASTYVDVFSDRIASYSEPIGSTSHELIMEWKPAGWRAVIAACGPQMCPPPHQPHM